MLDKTKSKRRTLDKLYISAEKSFAAKLRFLEDFKIKSMVYSGRGGYADEIIAKSLFGFP